jgi:hypothetical protein
MDNYRIYHRDKSKFYDVPYRSYNAETPIIMNGKNSSEYGTDLNKNFINLLSNFANDTPDARSIEGQLWYDSKNKVLNLKDNTGFQKIGYIRPPIVPDDALKEFELSMEMLNYLSVDGGILSGKLLLKDVEESDSENSAVHKNFVDGKKPPIPLGYIPLAGNSHIATGKLYLPNVAPSEDLQAAPKSYADKIIPQIKKIAENAKITSTSNAGLLKGYANVIEHHPYGLVYIFGESYIPSDNVSTTISIGAIGNIKNYQAQVSIINNTNPDITVDCVFKVENNEGSLTIIRHNNSSTDALTVHYIITGIKK